MRVSRRLNTLSLSLFSLIFFLISTALAPAQKPQGYRDTNGKVHLPTGAWLDPEGRSFDLGNMPMAMKFSPDGRFIVVSLNGWREQGIQIVDRSSGQVVQTIIQPAAFLGLVFSADGKSLYVSGANEDCVFRYDWQDGHATLADKLVLAEKDPKKDGTRFPAGIAISNDGKLLYVAENVADSLAVIDLSTKRVVQRLRTDHYPYEVIASANHKVYVSAWGADTVDVYKSNREGTLEQSGKIPAGRHPSAMLLNASGNRLFAVSASTDRIPVIDTRTDRVVKHLADSPPSGTREGSTPDALALSPDGTRLFVAEADNNAVAVFDLSRLTAGRKSTTVSDRLVGRIPCGWYPTAVLAADDSLFVLNGKGKGTGPNRAMMQPNLKLDHQSTEYTLGQLSGTLTVTSSHPAASELRRFTQRVFQANNWGEVRSTPKYPPFKHVVYIIKENRTYDQMFGDVKAGDGEPSLLFFTKETNPNHRALAERFGLFDRFFVNAEVSMQGHPWSTSAYVTDYSEKITPTYYSFRRYTPDDEGEVDEPVSGFLWDSAIRKGLTLRDYGEYAEPVKTEPEDKGKPTRYRSTKRSLAPYTSSEYPSFDLDIRDQVRADIWIKEFQKYVSTGTMPALEIMHLPADHTAGGKAGMATPRAYMADNDLALARIIEAVSKSKYWKDTVFFILEDDAQAGPDHVDSHRSVLMVISAYNRGGTIHRFVNTTDVVATIEEILGLQPLSQFDRFGEPLREIFGSQPDLHPYIAMTPTQSMDEMNPKEGSVAEESLKLDLRKEDVADMDLFNHILWRAIKGDVISYPGEKRVSSLEYLRAR